MNYPKWIDEYAKASYQLFSGNVLEAFAPLDFYHFNPLWYDLWTEKIYHGIALVEKRRISFQELKKYLPSSSSIRAFLVKMIPAFLHFKKRNPAHFKKVINFFYQILKQYNKKDIFALKANIIHSEKEVEDILKKIKWAKADKIIASEIGRLTMGLGNLVNGLYNDVVTDMGWEVCGPYNLSKKFGPNTFLLIRDFPDLKPSELWPQAKNFKHSNIKIFAIYKKIKCQIRYVGCHTVFNGSPVDNMVQYAILADGRYCNNPQEIKKLKEYFLRLAAYQWPKLRSLDFERLKQKVMLQESYQLHKFFNFLGLDWRPSKEMRQRIKNKPLLKNLYPRGRIISFKEYCRFFGVDELKSLYRFKKT